MAGSYKSFIFRLLGNFYAVFHNDHSSLHSLKQWVRVFVPYVLVSIYCFLIFGFTRVKSNLIVFVGCLFFMASGTEDFFLPVCHLYFNLWKLPVYLLYSFPNWIIHCVAIDFLELFINVGYSSFTHYIVCKSFVSCLFTLFKDFFALQKLLSMT